PFSRRTRNIVLGRVSMTTPFISIWSSFGIGNQNWLITIKKWCLKMEELSTKSRKRIRYDAFIRQAFNHNLDYFSFSFFNVFFLGKKCFFLCFFFVLFFWRRLRHRRYYQAFFILVFFLMLLRAGFIHHHRFIFFDEGSDFASHGLKFKFWN